MSTISNQSTLRITSRTESQISISTQTPASRTLRALNCPIEMSWECDLSRIMGTSSIYRNKNRPLRMMKAIRASSSSIQRALLSEDLTSQAFRVVFQAETAGFWWMHQALICSRSFMLSSFLSRFLISIKCKWKNWFLSQ